MKCSLCDEPVRTHTHFKGLLELWKDRSMTESDRWRLEYIERPYGVIIQFWHGDFCKGSVTLPGDEGRELFNDINAFIKSKEDERLQTNTGTSSTIR